MWDPEFYKSKHSFVHEYGSDLLGLLDPQPGEKILDLGCGSGELSAAIQEKGSRVTGLDMSEAMIRSARAQYPGIEFLVGDAIEFERSEHFDSIFSNATLHWILDPEAAVAAMWKNLKSGGRLILEMGGKDNITTIEQQLRTSLLNRGYRKQAELELWYFPTIGQYTSLLEAAGFRVLRAELFPRPTRLADDQHGIKDWLSMFAAPFFEGIPQKDQDLIKEEVQTKLNSSCLRAGNWYADYVRLRVIACKIDP